MKLLLKILFFVFAIFQTNICEAKVLLFGEVVTQIRFIENAIENKNEATINSENEIAITCKSESDLLDYRNWALSIGAVAAKGALSTTQLVQKSATLAERAVGGTGRFAGTAKHTYANNLLSRYQSIYGSRGLQFNNYFNNGVGNRGFLDVVNHGSKTIYDFKFGSATWRSGQLLKYQRNFPGYNIQIIRP